MLLEQELEILELMEKHDLEYETAKHRYERKLRQLELANERMEAHKVKSVMTKEKQEAFRHANKDLH